RSGGRVRVSAVDFRKTLILPALRAGPLPLPRCGRGAKAGLAAPLSARVRAPVGWRIFDAPGRRGMTVRDVAPAVSRSAWLTLGGAFTAFTLSAALMHSYPVYLVAFIAEFGWSRAETSIAYSVSQLVAGVSSPLVGFLVDRLGPRRLLLIGGGLLVAGLFASAFVTALWQIILLYGIVMTVGANCLGLVVFVPMLSRYFVRRRGMAISIVQSANGIARGISAPLVQLLISLIGWRTTYLVQAAFVAACVVPLAALF